MLSLQSLSFADHFSQNRESLLAALAELCAADADQDAAAKILKLGVKARAELLHNQVLTTSGVLPAIDRYTGVLYDALAADTLDPLARSWVDEHVLVQSALFGRIRSNDLIPAYRLSASTRLPGVALPLKKMWSTAHAGIDADASNFILDLRSKDYQALGPISNTNSVVLDLFFRDAHGELRALNHFNKAAKGELVRRMARTGVELTSRNDFADWAAEQGYEVCSSEVEGHLTFVSTFGAPQAVLTGSASNS